jgi:hypothetical protein
VFGNPHDADIEETAGDRAEDKDNEQGHSRVESLTLTFFMVCVARPRLWYVILNRGKNETRSASKLR